jgi:hypothetical protein
MHSDWFKGIDILQGRWQHGEKVGYCYPSGLEKTLCKWEIFVPLVTKGLTGTYLPYGFSNVAITGIDDVQRTVLSTVHAVKRSERHDSYRHLVVLRESLNSHVKVILLRF